MLEVFRKMSEDERGPHKQTHSEKKMYFFRRRQPDSNQSLSSQTEQESEPYSESQKSGRKLGRQVSVSPNQEIKTLVNF